MKLKTLILSLALSFIITSAKAGIISDLEKRYDHLKSWQADFDQTTYVEMLAKKLTKQGKIHVSRPDNLRIEYLSAPFKIYASNGKNLWVYKKDDDTAWQFKKPKNIISTEALSFLSGMQNMSKIFDVQKTVTLFDGPLHINNQALTKVHLIPKDQDSVSGIILGVDSKTHIIKEALLQNTSGNVSHYVFKDVVFDQVLDETLFTLPKEPKRKIIRK